MLLTFGFLGDLCFSGRNYEKVMNSVMPDEIITFKFIRALQMMVVVVGHRQSVILITCNPETDDFTIHNTVHERFRIKYFPKLDDSFLYVSFGRCDTLSVTILPDVCQQAVDLISKLDLPTFD